jgi:hypothetical protein
MVAWHCHDFGCVYPQVLEIAQQHLQQGSMAASTTLVLSIPGEEHTIKLAGDGFQLFCDTRKCSFERVFPGIMYYPANPRLVIVPIERRCGCGDVSIGDM